MIGDLPSSRTVPAVGTGESVRYALFVTALAAVFLAVGCARPADVAPIDGRGLPVHLEEHMDAASVVGSMPPDDVPAVIVFGPEDLRADWKPATPLVTTFGPLKTSFSEGLLRLELGAENRNPSNRRLTGSIFVELPDLHLSDWAYVEISARASPETRNLGTAFNYTEEDPQNAAFPWYSFGESVPLVSDETEQTYRVPLRPQRSVDGPWTELEIGVNTRAGAESAYLDVFSVRLIPRALDFAAEPFGVRLHAPVGPGGPSAVERISLYTHAPARVTFPVVIAPEARLDFGVTVLDQESSVAFRVLAERPQADPEVLFVETRSDPTAWADRSIDLAHLAGESVDLVLETSSPDGAAVGLWGAPTLVGRRDPGTPNVVFYVIDGAGADYMTVYGYNRRNTPNLERIAAGGAVFERAYSNSGWTRPSTASFLTSLQHSSMGGLRNGVNPVPADVPTMAEHMHRAGFQTAALTTNPNAGRMSGLDRGVDVFRDAGAEVTSTSSVELHKDFWRWREAYPGEPYWVHFQTTDLHGPHTPVPPFAGLFLSPGRRALLDQWEALLAEASGDGRGIWGGSFEEAGVDRVAYATAYRDYYDEGVAHQDFQLGAFVDRLKAAGEWENTLLIIASDHGAAAGSQDWGMLMREDAPAALDFSDPGTPILRSGISRIPLIFVWPGKIAPGQRIDEPVSMIDVMPTVLDLIGLPPAEIAQGQSLAPLLLGRDGWESRPVILDEFEVDRDSGELRGRIEVIDGRWGASLEINGDPTVRAELRRPVPLLLYDLWDDPNALHSLHEERPDLVAEYTRFLESQFEAHQALAERVAHGASGALTPEQLRALRSLGYIR